MAVKYFLLPVLGHVDERPGDSAFRYESCPTCGRQRRVQKSDLDLRVIDPPMPKVTTTLEGDLLVPPNVVNSLKNLGADIEAREVKGPGQEDFRQVIPLCSVEPASESLLEPRQPCPECGGVTRFRMSVNAPLAITRPNGAFVHVVGAPTMVVFSEDVLELLQEVDLSFYGRPVKVID